MTAPGLTSIEVSALGARIVCQPGDEASRLAVQRAWEDALTTEVFTGEPGKQVPTLSVGLDPSHDVHGRDLAEILHLLSPSVTQRAIAANQGELVMLHAAALADPRTGATAVLVAPSGTGKTTACRTLGRTLAYLSDETAAITRDGVVLPYRKPLSVVQDGPFKSQHSPSELGLLTTERECHLAALLVIQRRPNHPDRPEVRPLDTIDAIAALAPESSYLPSLDRPLHRLAEVIDMAGGAHHVTYREAATLETVLDELLGAGR